jgi:hypothetical protein
MESRLTSYSWFSSPRVIRSNFAPLHKETENMWSLPILICSMNSRVSLLTKVWKLLFQVLLSSVEKTVKVHSFLHLEKKVTLKKCLMMELLIKPLPSKEKLTSSSTPVRQNKWTNLRLPCLTQKSILCKLYNSSRKNKIRVSGFIWQVKNLLPNYKIWSSQQVFNYSEFNKQI